jgi:hypothetical protein
MDIDHQDRTTSHDNKHNNNLTHNNKQLNNNIPSINIHPFTKNLDVLDVDNMDTIREVSIPSNITEVSIG